MSPVRIALGIVGSAIVWVAFRRGHGEQDIEPAYLHFIHAPSWLNWLCGRPRVDNRLELAAMVAQIGGLISILLWLPMGLLGLDERLQALLYGYAFCGTFFAAFFVRITIRIINMFKGRDGDFSNSSDTLE